MFAASGEDSRLKLGAFLAHSQFQTSSHTSALFLTAAAQNLLCLKLASDIIGPVSNAFGTWLIGGLLPAAIGMDSFCMNTGCLLPSKGESS